MKKADFSRFRRQRENYFKIFFKGKMRKNAAIKNKV
jgi:hypothetical protein